MAGAGFRNYFRSAGLVAGAGAASLAMTIGAFAQEGYAHPGQITLQTSQTPIMDSITAFNDGVLLPIVAAIVGLVLVLLLIVIVRFNKRANPVPAKFTHNTVVEIVWTVLPILILIVIAVPSFGVLADQLNVPDGQRKYLGANIFSWGEVEVPAPGLTVKVTGNQWYWDYEYADQGLTFTSTILPEVDPTGKNADRPTLKPNQPRLLAVDNELVVPVDTTVRVQVTAGDVIHAFAMPSFGIKIDAVPGRLNETWFNVRKTGIYYGQCSELCGQDHAFMPIAIRVVTKDEFDGWIAAFEAGDLESANMTLAAVN